MTIWLILLLAPLLVTVGLYCWLTHIGFLVMPLAQALKFVLIVAVPLALLALVIWWVGYSGLWYLSPLY